MAKKPFVGVTLEQEAYDRLYALKKVAPVSLADLVRHAVNVLLEDPAAHPIPLVPLEPKSGEVTFK